MSYPTTAPSFMCIGGRILNATQIKYVGTRPVAMGSDRRQVYIEFITGGFTTLDPEITLEDFEALLRRANLP